MRAGSAYFPPLRTSSPTVKLAETFCARTDAPVDSSGRPALFGSQCSCPGPIAPVVSASTRPDGNVSLSIAGPSRVKPSPRPNASPRPNDSPSANASASASANASSPNPSVSVNASPGATSNGDSNPPGTGCSPYVSDMSPPPVQRASAAGRRCWVSTGDLRALRSRPAADDHSVMTRRVYEPSGCTGDGPGATVSYSTQA